LRTGTPQVNFKTSFSCVCKTRY